ncbi:hypothetical protein HII31_04741 [Pseudocercospora fuligena]|uniref:Uncharacterized protein n=1 Tax=Pseudocercospora fuligena TaxID=685502 RepID=A0A8H6RPG1_9PEZI|nr:hypothetical protein HII31_04741 [Pseudocercospora fuligena]
MSRPALEPLGQFSERQQQRDTLRTAAQKSGKETDRAHTILEWGGNIQSTLSILPIERPFSDTKPAMLDRTWPSSFTKESRLQRAARPRVPLEPEYGESCDPFKGKKNQKAVVHAEEIFDFGRYSEDEAKRVMVNGAVDTGESTGCGMSNAREEVVGGRRNGSLGY